MNGDILAVEADAAVLSAHPTLVVGSGLSGHFHREAGPELEEAESTQASLISSDQIPAV